MKKIILSIYKWYKYKKVMKALKKPRKYVY